MDTISRQGFGYNRSNNALYTKPVQETQKAVVKYDSLAQDVLDIIELTPGTAQKGMIGDNFFNEAIVINPVTNKVYVSDSDKSVLCAIVG